MGYSRGEARDASRFIRAGYREEPELNIEWTRAGSQRDRLRDLNRPGYKTQEPSPDPIHFAGAERLRTAQSSRKASRLDRVRKEAAEDRAGATACALLLALVLVLGGVWADRLHESLDNRRSIAAYNTRTAALIEANESLQAQLLAVTSGDRIRNLAQNSYGMLRRERAQVHEIYVQMPSGTQVGGADFASNHQIELLDVLLGIMERFHIGG